jgi:hypothetical protein
MNGKKIVPAVFGVLVSLGLLYVTVRVVSNAWKKGQNA